MLRNQETASLVERYLSPEQARKSIAELRLIDDELMQPCLKGRADCLGYIARVVTGDDSLEVVEVRDQEVLPGLGAHGVRLDFLCATADGRMVDIEVESGSDGFPPRRARYYAAMVDSRLLNPGERYDSLPDQVIVVLCGGDALRCGRQKSVVSRRIEEDGSPFGDGSAIIYVDCTVHDDTPLGRLAHDMMCADPDDMHPGLLADCVRAYKESEADMRYTTGSETLNRAMGLAFADGEEKGRAEGEEKGRAEVALNLLRAGVLDERQVSEATGIPLGEVEAMAERARVSG